MRPDPDHPAYYLPFPMGYKDSGAYVANFQRPPPSADEVQVMMGRVLDQQGYRLMTKQNHPTLVLYYWWGYIAPQIVQHMSISNTADLSNSGGYVPLNQGDAFINEAAMLSMVGGETMDDKFDTTDSQKMEIVRASRSARWYVLVSAFDFGSWLKNLKEEKNKEKGGTVVDQPVLLWRAHISTELWGHYLDQVLPTLIATAGPMLGRETTRPQLIRIPYVPAGEGHSRLARGEGFFRLLRAGPGDEVIVKRVKRWLFGGLGVALALSRGLPRRCRQPPALLRASPRGSWVESGQKPVISSVVSASRESR